MAADDVEKTARPPAADGAAPTVSILSGSWLLAQSLAHSAQSWSVAGEYPAASFADVPMTCT
ncbi:MAG: hypothetical protein ACJ8H8_02335 [Geminicoccaceae bacterium]